MCTLTTDNKFIVARDLFCVGNDVGANATVSFIFVMQSAVCRLHSDSTRRRHREIQVNSTPSSRWSAVLRKASEILLWGIVYIWSYGIPKHFTNCHLYRGWYLFWDWTRHKDTTKQSQPRKGNCKLQCPSYRGWGQGITFQTRIQLGHLIPWTQRIQNPYFCDCFSKLKQKMCISSQPTYCLCL